jgi:hypothetical protein
MNIRSGVKSIQSIDIIYHLRNAFIESNSFWQSQGLVVPRDGAYEIYTSEKKGAFAIKVRFHRLSTSLLHEFDTYLINFIAYRHSSHQKPPFLNPLVTR